MFEWREKTVNLSSLTLEISIFNFYNKTAESLTHGDYSVVPITPIPCRSCCCYSHKLPVCSHFANRLKALAIHRSIPNCSTWYSYTQQLNACGAGGFSCSRWLCKDGGCIKSRCRVIGHLPVIDEFPLFFFLFNLCCWQSPPWESLRIFFLKDAR